jgi:hypothetical protein
MTLTDEEYLLLYIALLAGCFALCTSSTFQSIGFLMERQAKLQIICFICCCCGAINLCMLLFLTIFPPGHCWWIPVGSLFYQASVISTTFLMVFRAYAVITLTSIGFRRTFWVFSSFIIAAQVGTGLALCIKAMPVQLANGACSPVLSPYLAAGWYASLILGAVILTALFSHQMIKARRVRKDSLLQIIFISSAASATLSGISQFVFSLLLVMSVVPAKYELILVKSDMTINVLITANFVKRLMRESSIHNMRSVRSSMQAQQLPLPPVKSLERQMESGQLNAVESTAVCHASGEGSR